MTDTAIVSGTTGTHPRDAALATRLVKRRCGPDAPLVLAILGLDTPPPPAPRREPGQRAVPNPFRRSTKGKGKGRRW